MTLLLQKQQKEACYHITIKATLTALTQVLNSMLYKSTLCSKIVSVEPNIIITALTRHLKNDDTSDQSIQTLSILLSLSEVVDNKLLGRDIRFEYWLLLLY